MKLGRVDVQRKLIALLSVSALAAVCLSTSVEAGPGKKCGHARHRLLGHCVSSLVGHPSQPETDGMAQLLPPVLGFGAGLPPTGDPVSMLVNLGF
jgi:hypothetical protein